MALVVFAATLVLGSLNQLQPLNIQPGIPARALMACVPLAAASVAARAVLRPWPAILAVLLLTPVWDAGQVSWIAPQVQLVRTAELSLQTPPIQVILQTAFVLALAIGCLLRDREVRLPPAEPLPARSRRLPLPASHHVGWAAVVGVLALAAVSTLRSPNYDESLTVLVHGILEPVAMGALVLALAGTRRRLALILVALGVSVVIGGAIDMIQSIPTIGSLHSLQSDRLLFSRLTYFNVGLFGEMVAMAAPLLLGAIAARRYLRLNRGVVGALAIALAIGGASLFLTFSKSAYLATAGGIIVFLMLNSGAWRRRASIIAGSIMLSAVVVPWPTLVLSVAPPVDAAYRAALTRVEGASRLDSWNPATLSGTGSLLERLYATTAALKMAADHPLLGVGLDQFGPQYAAVYQQPQSHFAADSAHTFWPEVAAELGIPALILVVVIFAAAMLALWRLYRAPPDGLTRILAVTLLASLAAWLIVATAFAGDMYRPWRNMSSDFVMMAVLVAAAFALSRSVHPWPVRRRKAVAAKAEETA
jgi:O-antigen ligase